MIDWLKVNEFSKKINKKSIRSFYILLKYCSVPVKLRKKYNKIIKKRLRDFFLT